MSLYENGRRITRPFDEGTRVRSGFMNGTKVMAEGVGGRFRFENAGINFSVSVAGIVSLSISQGTIASADYTDGQDLGYVSSNTPRHNDIVVTVPAGYRNAGNTVDGRVSFTQLKVDQPTVTTDAASNKISTTARLNGTHTGDGGADLTASGFYIIKGSGYGTSGIINFGDEAPVNDLVDTFSVNVSVDPDSNYQYVAYAENDAGLTGYGSVVSFKSALPTATASWVFSSADPFEGGTLSDVISSTVGDWYGASDIVTNSSGVAISAGCGSDAETCTVYRDTVSRNRYTGATRDAEYVCTKSVGSGTPSCTSPTGAIGDIDERVETGSRIAEETTTEDLVVTNSEFNAGTSEWNAEQIIVEECSVNQAGTLASISTNYGTTTVTNLSQVSANTGTTNQYPNLTFDVTGSIDDIPEGFHYEENEDNTWTFTGLTAENCEQPGVTIVTPKFNANSAIINSLLINNNDGEAMLADGDIFSIAGETGTYTITAPTGVGGTVQTPDGENGDGKFNVPGGGSNTHSFFITNSLGTATYSFEIEATR